MRRRSNLRASLSSLYKRMGRLASSGMKRLRARANRAGPEHLAADAQDFEYIEREAHDIINAIHRLRERDAGEYPPSNAFEIDPMTSPATTVSPPVGVPMPEVWEGERDTMIPETRMTGNMARGRRNRAGSGLQPVRVVTYHKISNPNGPETIGVGMVDGSAFSDRRKLVAALKTRGLLPKGERIVSARSTGNQVVFFPSRSSTQHSYVLTIEG